MRPSENLILMKMVNVIVCIHIKKCHEFSLDYFQQVTQPWWCLAKMMWKGIRISSWKIFWLGGFSRRFDFKYLIPTKNSYSHLESTALKIKLFLFMLVDGITKTEIIWVGVVSFSWRVVACTCIPGNLNVNSKPVTEYTSIRGW